MKQYEQQLRIAKDNHQQESIDSLSTVIGRCQYWLGLNLLETEEISEGERLLVTAMNKLEGCTFSHPIDLVDGHNQLAIVYTNRAHYNRAKETLIKAQKIYQQVKKAREQYLHQQHGRPERMISLEKEQRDTDYNDKDNDKSHHNEEKENITEKPALAVTNLGDSPYVLTEGQWVVLDKLHTMTLFYLAQVYGKLEKKQLVNISSR